MPITVVLVGQGQAAGEAISLPAGIEAAGILSAVRARLTEGTPNTFTVTTLTVVSGTPSSGQIALSSDGKSIILGDTFAETDLLILVLLLKGETVKPTTV